MQHPVTGPQPPALTGPALPYFNSSTSIPSFGLPPRRRAALSRHRRKCIICSHPQRDAIDAAFLRFRSPSQIAADFGLPDRRPIYRHAHALRLFPRRNRKLISSYDLILEHAMRCVPTFADLITTVERHSKIDSSFENIRRPRTRRIRLTLGESDAAPNPLTASARPPTSNRHTPRLEPPLSHSKQTTATPSNRHKFDVSSSAKNRSKARNKSLLVPLAALHLPGLEHLRGFKISIDPITGRLLQFGSADEPSGGANSLNPPPNPCSSTSG